MGSMGAMPEYQPYQPGEPVSRPASIAMAVKLMYVGAGLSLISALSIVFLRDTFRSAIEKAASTSNPPLSSSQIDAVVNFSIGAVVAIGLLGAGLWLWMAYANGKGRKWARTMATIFFALDVLSVLSSVLQHGPAASLALNVLTLLLGAYIIFLLYRPESSQYYAAQSAPRG
jgi:sterol desaturase/sphingolipid hydroxylase (fatty acid hydroxylase superfamily)